jgi:NAD(P)-dependent dehydrogenase (short-subunit alcohol dehydrogenase family)
MILKRQSSTASAAFVSLLCATTSTKFSIFKPSIIISTRLFATALNYNMDTSKKCCIVVGLGRGGIGDSLANKFSQEGYNVAMVARSDLKRLEEDIPNSKSYQCDASDADQVKSTVQAITADMGDSIDALLYNAGSGVFKSFADLSYDEFALSWKTGPSGIFLWTKACLPYMPKGSCIGLTGATASWRGMPYTAAFASSKMATRGLGQALARDLGPTKGIHVFHVIIDGIVNLGETTKEQMPDKKESELLDPAQIAETYYILSQQPPTCWTQETHIGAADAYGSIASI